MADINNLKIALTQMEKEVGYFQAREALCRIVPGVKIHELESIPTQDIPRVVEYINAARIYEKITFPVII